MKTKFELRADAEELAGGTVHIGDGKTFDVAKALRGGKGTIETSDPAVIDALSKLPVLKTITAKAEQSAKKED